MRNNHRWFHACLCILLGIMAALVLLALSNYGAYAEALPSPKAADFLRLDGDLELAPAGVDLEITDCLRVNIPTVHDDGAWADLTLPYVPPSIRHVLLFDGYHLFHADWEQIEDYTLRIHFWADDLARLDGTVGLYLLIVAE